jgi:hypothetical protein
MAETLVYWAGRVLGQCELVRDCSWDHRQSRVLKLRDELGAEWILKQHRDRERYQAEVTAYRQWVPAMGDRAPQVRAHDDGLQAILITAVPGRLAPWPGPPDSGPSQADGVAERAVQRDAGVALRLLHGAQPSLPWPGLGAAKLAEFDGLAGPASGLLSSRELRIARSEVAALTGVTGACLVPCHRDYTPRNWITEGTRVRVIDFEWTRLDAAATDLARLHLGIWEGRPDLREAFLDGYGQIDDTGQAILRGCAALTAVWLTIKARETRQPSFEQASRAALHRLIAGKAGTR